MVLIMLVLAAGCVSNSGRAETATNPLATVQGGRAPGGEFGIAGDIMFSSDCVVVDDILTNKNFTPVWPDEFTSWDADSESLIFESLFHGTVEVGSGDRVTLIGLDSSQAPWLEEPAPTCPLDRFFVSDLIPSTSGGSD